MESWAKSCSPILCDVLECSISPPLAASSFIEASRFEVSFSKDVDRINVVAAYLIGEAWGEILGEGEVSQEEY